MTSVGERLRRERVNHGIDLPAISRRTRISERYLEAIETGNLDVLPSGFFYRSFVRQYGSALGLNTDELEAELEAARKAEVPVLTMALQQAEFKPKPQDHFISESNRRSPGTNRIGASVVLLIAVLTACSTFYAWWHSFRPGPASTKLVPRMALAAPATTPSQPPTPATAQRPQPAAPLSTAVQVPSNTRPESQQDLEGSEDKTETPEPAPAIPAVKNNYLQVAALTRPQAELFVLRLAQKGFHALYTRAPVPNTYRVLVGPFEDATALAKARTNLNKAGLNGPDGYARNRSSKLRRPSHKRARSV